MGKVTGFMEITGKEEFSVEAPKLSKFITVFVVFGNSIGGCGEHLEIGDVGMFGVFNGKEQLKIATASAF